MDAPSQTRLPAPSATPRLGFPELVALAAAVMALNALAIDMMLPALGQIGADLGAARDNDRQLIIVVYVVSNGVAQLFFGPLVDRFGRKRVLLWALAGYVTGSLLSVVAASFSLFLVARAFQGAMTAAARVAMLAVVRDQCAGRKMAEVMSLAITVLMAAPILAPGLGQLILLALPWRWIFIALLFYGLALAVWIGVRAPETLAPEDRKALRPRAIAGAYGVFVRNRTSLGYTLVSCLCFSALFSYVSAAEQIFLETFEIGTGFAIAFAAIAASLGAATMINAWLVSRFGMRRLCHGALMTFVGASLVHLVTATLAGETFILFMGFMSVGFFCLGLIGPNCTAMAMEPMGRNAGAAAAATGFAGTAVAGAIGGAIAQFYDGTTMPLLIGFVLLGFLAFIAALWTERGRLFQPQSPTPGKDPS